MEASALSVCPFCTLDGMSITAFSSTRVTPVATTAAGRQWQLVPGTRLPTTCSSQITKRTSPLLMYDAGCLYMHEAFCSYARLPKRAQQHCLSAAFGHQGASKDDGHVIVTRQGGIVNAYKGWRAGGALLLPMGLHQASTAHVVFKIYEAVEMKPLLDAANEAKAADATS
eukprot:357274-Chlamydomonas_euryale.AAC.25